MVSHEKTETPKSEGMRGDHACPMGKLNIKNGFSGMHEFPVEWNHLVIGR